MADLITMFHPSVPGSTTTAERDVFRKVWYVLGWRTNDDPATAVDHQTPGSLIDSAVLNADSAAFTAATEITTAARVTLPMLGQPILLEADFQMASVTSASTPSIGFAKIADAANPFAWVAARRFPLIPIDGEAGVGSPYRLRCLVPANTPATDWTIAGKRDSGTGTLQLKANAIYSGLVTAKAA